MNVFPQKRNRLFLKTQLFDPFGKSSVTLSLGGKIRASEGGEGGSNDERTARNWGPWKCGTNLIQVCLWISALAELTGMAPTSCKGTRRNAEPTALSVFLGYMFWR